MATHNLRRPCGHGQYDACPGAAYCNGGTTLSDAEALRLILDTHREALVQDGWDTETVPSLIDALVAAVEVEEADA